MEAAGSAHRKVLGLAPERVVLAQQPLPLLPQLLHVALPRQLIGLHQVPACKQLIGASYNELDSLQAFWRRIQEAWKENGRTQAN